MPIRPQHAITHQRKGEVVPIFLILHKMGMDGRSALPLVPRSGLKKDVRRIVGITQEAIRSTRYRILQNMKK